MNSEFDLTELGNICEFQAGSVFKKNLQGISSGDHPFIKVSDMNRPGNETYISRAENWISEAVREEIRAKLHNVGAIVFAKIGVALTFNRRRVLTRPTLIDNNMLSAQAKNGNCNRYIYYLLSKIDFNLYSKGSALPYLNISDLAKIKVVVPPLGQQKTIASVLGTLDDKIDNNRKMNETLEEMARVIFKSWFIDFDPVHEKATGRSPAHMGEEIAALFPSSFSEDGLPAGWINKTLGDVCNITSGKRPPIKKTSPDNDSKIPVYGGNGIAWYTNEVLFKPPFIITGRVGTLGTVYRVYEKCWVSDNALCCFPNNKDALELIYFVMKEIDYQSLNSGSTQPLLTQTRLKSQKIITPTKEVVAAFHQKTEILFNKILDNDKKNKTLTELRETLQPKLMSGEINVKDAEREVEAVI